MHCFGRHTCFVRSLLATLLFLLVFSTLSQADIHFNEPLVRVSWSASQAADTKGYEVHRATASAGPYAKISPNLVTAPQWSDTGVTDGNTYYYRVKSVDTCGNTSDLSAVSPAAIIELDSPPVVYFNQRLVRVSWNACPDADAKGYEVHRATASAGPYTRISPSLITALQWSDTSVIDGGMYYYRVKAVDTCGNTSDLSAVSPAAVINLSGLTVAASPPAGTYDEAISVALQSSSPATIHYTTNGSAPTRASAVYSAPILLSRTTTLKYFAVDSASNESPVQTSEYVMVLSGDDYDSDGYSNSLEEAMGTDPHDPASQPEAASITISPLNGPLSIGANEQLSVTGTFAPATGDPIECDVCSLVQYHFDSSLVSVSGSGMVTGKTEGISNIYAQQMASGSVISTSNTIKATVDATAPRVDLFETRPYQNQGTSQDSGPTPRVPVDTGIVIRVVDNSVGENIGIDEGTIELLVNQAQAPVKVREVVQGDLHEMDIAFQNTDPFNFDETVTVELKLADMAGNPMAFTHSFQMESQTEHQWALDNSPPQSTASQGSGISQVSLLPEADELDDEQLAGARVVFNDYETLKPRVGPINEIPQLDLANPVGIPLNLEPTTVFDGPVTVFVPAPGAQLQDTNQDSIPDAGLENYEVYLFSPNPDVLWRNALDASSCIVEGSRKDHYDTEPPCIEIQLTQPVAIQIGTDNASSEPIPDIKVNGKDDAVYVTKGSKLSVSVSLSGSDMEQPVDWWILAFTPRGWYSFNMNTRKWVKGIVPSQQVAPADLPAEEIYVGNPPFGMGGYVFCFWLDDNSDGSVDGTWRDSVHVVVYR